MYFLFFYFFYAPQTVIISVHNSFNYLRGAQHKFKPRCVSRRNQPHKVNECTKAQQHKNMCMCTFCTHHHLYIWNNSFVKYAAPRRRLTLFYANRNYYRYTHHMSTSLMLNGFYFSSYTTHILVKLN